MNRATRIHTRTVLAVLIVVVGGSCKGGAATTTTSRVPGFADNLDAARAFVARFLERGADYRALTLSLRPRTTDYARVFVGSAADAARRGYKKLWAVAARQPIRPRSYHTRAELWQTTSDGIKAGDPQALLHFPAGYKRIAQHLQPRLNIYRFKFVASGNQPWLAFDGLLNVDGRWVLMPQPWRALASNKRQPVPR